MENKKQTQINKAQELVIESYEARESGAKDYTLEEVFDIIQNDIEN